MSIAESEMKIKDGIKIEGFQNFEQYMKINSINIRIIDPEIQGKFLFYSKKSINKDLLLTAHYFVLQLSKMRYFYYNKWFKQRKRYFN